MTDRPASPLPGTGPARRSNARFVLPTALASCTLALLAAFWLYSNWPVHSEAGDALRQANTRRTELVNRLRVAEHVLRAVAADVALRGHEAVVLGATEKRYFVALALTASGAPPVQLFGRVATAPALSDPMQRRLGNGDSIIATTARDDATAGRIMLVRSLTGSGAPGELLVAELDRRYLWGTPGGRGDAADFCLRDEGGTLLHCSTPQAREALGPLEQQLPGVSGALQWQSGSKTWHGAYTRLDLAAPFIEGNWAVLVLASGDPGTGLAWGLGAGLVAAVLLGSLAALVMLRQRRSTTAVGNLAGAGEARNALVGAGATGPMAHMALRLERQSSTIRAMAEIDRALLSGANAQRLVELVAGHLLACTGCDVLLIGMLDHDVERSVTVVVALKGEGELLSEKQSVDPSASRLLALPPDGSWLDQVRAFTLLEPQARRGAMGALVLPIYVAGKPVGIVSLGLASASATGIGTDEANNARALAGRLGAALTSAARDRTLHTQTHFDATTSLPNWQYLKAHLGNHMSRARRDSARLALLFIDLDGFKKVNRSKGHSQGDLVLAEAAERMRGCVRDEDLVTRFGGDEFVVVLPRVSQGVDARRVADKLIEALAKPFLVDDEEQHLGCSLGISLFPDDAQTTDGMLRSADSALSDAKSAGGGRYAFFDAAINRAAVARSELEQDLRRALANEEFVVFYQPQINLDLGHIDGVEALVRWRHPTRGLVSPAEFIAVAERAGLIAQIGEYVMRTACAQFSAWDAMGIAPTRISVNVSGLEIARTDIVARVESILRETGLRPLHLELEITEGTFLDDSGGSLAKLNQLQQRGVRIAVDDFGTGYSSLSYLRRLPIDVVKIDQSFVHELAADRDSRSIVRAILKVAHSLDKLVVAEGVETSEQRALLASWDCDAGQGYLWSRPLPAPEFESFCRQWREAQQQPAAAG